MGKLGRVRRGLCDRTTGCHGVRTGNDEQVFESRIAGLLARDTTMVSALHVLAELERINLDNNIVSACHLSS